MGRHCHNICDNFLVQGCGKNNPSLYNTGYRFCTMCSKFIKLKNTIICPCCKSKTRSAPGNSRSRKKIIHARIH